jgi:hypothetical protein
MNEDVSLFDGIEEVHTCYERGQSYGLDRATYARVAQCAIACSRAGVEPSTIKRLSNGRPGADLVLYGRAAYTIRVEPPTISLFVISLDAKWIPLKPGHLLFQGEDSFRDWFKVTSTILGYGLENAEPLTLGELNPAYEASENIDKWLF